MQGEMRKQVSDGRNLTLGEWTNQDGKEREAERRLEGWRAEGPALFNGPFVSVVRPPALTGCCKKTSHLYKHTTHTHPVSLLSSFHISPSLYLFQGSGLYQQQQYPPPFTKA